MFDPDTLYVSRHAQQRAKLTWPGIGVRGIRRMLAASFEIDRRVAASLLGRRLEDVRDTYLMAPDLMGLFVLIPGDGRGPAMPTFLCFGVEQRRVAATLWPERVAA